MSSYSHSQPLPQDDHEPRYKKISGVSSAETPKGGRRPVKWVVVEKTMGLVPAQILAGRLQSEGIRARAMQEGAGRALGLTVGILGEGRVYVDEEQEEEARALIEAIQNEPIDWEIDEDEDPI